MPLNRCLLIRADAGPSIGAGHFMRCAALASEWAHRGGRVAFITSAPGTLLRYLPAGTEVIGFSGTPGSRRDAGETIAAMDTRGALWAVVDGYRFGPDYIDSLQAVGRKVLQFDDNGEWPQYHADIVLNQNIQADVRMYRGATTKSRLLLGTSHVLLRPAFRVFGAAEKFHPQRARRILISMGASDPRGVSAGVLWALRDIPDLEIIVLAGPLSVAYHDLEVLAASRSAVEVLHDPDDVPEIMSRVDMAIAAAGATVYELAYMRVPFIALTVADNQRLVERGLASRGFPCLGRWVSGMDSVLAAAVKELASDKERRTHLAQRGRELVDGMGAARVVDALLGEASR